MSSLVRLYLKAHPEASRCQTCGASLAVRCEHKPSREHPRGVFVTGPCANCARAPTAPKTNKVAPWFRGVSRELSALHVRFREALCLEALGFKSEQPVGPYRVDELHEGRRLVVEINGDAVHANPRKYKPRDVITLERARYTACEKWAADAKRLAAIEALGYQVIVAWEGDGVEKARAALQETIRAQDS